MALDWSWRIKKRNGLLQTIWNSGSACGLEHPLLMTTAVTAAASVPSSLTSTKVLWMTFSICRGEDDIAPKSASPVNASSMPRASSTGRKSAWNSNLNCGRRKSPLVIESCDGNRGQSASTMPRTSTALAFRRGCEGGRPPDKVCPVASRGSMITAEYSPVLP
eukprot:CAMPEP_0172776342 /NCGR_PEP_ID=MMETSP1074-20121228/199677_1 /TAXON_ID=2916 /ORGANISM="Ceratium fusus, Strain PA161109" /LENGTH=162 /DNA_ID=CAMNT_0013613099 /DNA_START=6 /DNA_END=494 /DNA_ORIENTATION=+